jgi:lipoprotein-anchoring transpeptidase ErfK/SrfK
METNMQRSNSILAVMATALPALILAGATSASAQDRSWVPWYEIGAPKGQPQQQLQGVTTSAQAKSKQRPARVARPAQDDDDNTSPFSTPTSRGGQVAYIPSQVKYPPLLQGGPRPEIYPQAPQTVGFTAGYGQGSIIIDTSGRALYYVLGGGQAYRYPISVGREGFTWRGTEKISRVAAWPDWRPPQEMRERDPRLPELMTGGVNNPLGAKALYLGNSLYRIHGTNDAKSIGYAASSGCFRMMNAHVQHLSQIAGVGTTVHVLDRLPNRLADTPAAPSVPKPKKNS